MQTIDIGIVLIGRNEGERLTRCLNSLKDFTSQLVYVDSNSTDDSLNKAQQHGAIVVSLDMSLPFSAARARNTGFKTLIKQFPELTMVHFIDGDCAVADGWLATAQTFLQQNQNVAIVCGRRRELYPHKSIYNQLCDDEWNTPIGEAKACGGDALMRVDVFKQVGGYRDDLIAGEEPELCIRIRKAGFKIWRISADMTWHDANMLQFKQWWKRCKRGGYAYAQGANLHGSAPEFHWVTESRRAWIWGFLMPVSIVTLAIFKPLFAILLLVYPLQWVRLSLKEMRKKNQLGFEKSGFGKRMKKAFFLLLSKFPEAAGQIKFKVNQITKQKGKLIEYK